MVAAALMYAAGESQADLGRGLGLSQGQVSRKQSGTTAWSLGDLDRLAAHYGIPAPELLRGADHAVRLLPAARRAACVGGTVLLHVSGRLLGGLGVCAPFTVACVALRCGKNGRLSGAAAWLPLADRSWRPRSPSAWLCARRRCGRQPAGAAVKG